MYRVNNIIFSSCRIVVRRLWKLPNVAHHIKNKNKKRKNKCISVQKMKFDDTKIL